MNELQVFMNKTFGQVRGCIVNDIPYLVGKDVTEILGFTNASKAIQDHVDDEDKILIESKTQSRIVIEFDFKELGQRGGWLINESGLYALVFGSELKSAKKFKKWVTKEVIPQIRLTGGYIPIKENEPNELLLARAIKVADETIRHKDEIIAIQEQRLNDLKPIEENYKLLMDTSGTFSMNKVAHYVGVGEYHLFVFLRSVNVIFLDDNNDNVPYENSVNKTKFKVVPAIAPDGSTHSVTRVLPKGIDYICKLLKKYGIVEVA